MNPLSPLVIASFYEFILQMLLEMLLALSGFGLERWAGSCCTGIRCRNPARKRTDIKLPRYPKWYRDPKPKDRTHHFLLCSLVSRQQPAQQHLRTSPFSIIHGRKSHPAPSGRSVDHFAAIFAKIQVLANPRFRHLRVAGHHKLVLHDEPVELFIASSQLYVEVRD